MAEFWHLTGSPLSLSRSPCRPPWPERGRRSYRECCLTSSALELGATH